ncbi:hypothetical protein C8R47DRAFT_1094895 [Mycena vitilis]|nr:hypothetical protein C8R47DRAFT_1094895 [Mycena vitilis]
MAFAPSPLQSQALSLSDIMHPMSPPRERISSSPVVETFPVHDIAQMRARALQMGLNSEDVIQPNSRERELLDMVLRLTNPNLVSLDPSQLVHQAEAIADLVHQRDYLARRVEEERSRWESEKEGWDRISEALLVRRSRKVNGPDESESNRMCQSLEFDNKALKEKLTHTQGRINALEAELTKLKPHLLMQPFVPRPIPIPARFKLPLVQLPSELEIHGTSEKTPLPPPTQSPPANATTTDAEPTDIVQPPSLHALAQASSYFTSLPFPSLQNVTSAANRKRKLAAQLKKALHPNTTIASSATQSGSSASVFPTPPASARTVLNTPGPPQRKLGRPAKTRRAPPQLFASDARAEHLLIAARRLGRERAGVVAGVISAERERMDHEKVEREKERIEREKERIEREKRNRGGGGYYRERPGPEPASKSGTASESPKRKERREEGGDSRFADAMAGYVNAAGQSASGDAKGKGKSVSTATPLDSLLDAARSIQHDANGAEPPTPSTSSTGAGMMTRRRTATNDQAGTPAPKRRRLSSNASDTHSRARTALDVLADQAAVAGSSDAPGKGKGKSKAKGKGKGKGVADELADNAVPVVKRKRGRPPNKDRNKPSPAAASSTSRLISPTSSAGPSHANGETGESSRPVTRWVQRGRLAGSASSRPPPRQRDDVESEDEPDEAIETDQAAKPPPAPAPETEQEPAPLPAPEVQSESNLVPRTAVAESAPDPPVESENVDPVVQPTAVLGPLPIDEAAPTAQDNTVIVAGPVETQIPPSPPMLEDPVLDADADGEDDPDVDMDGIHPSLL